MLNQTHSDVTAVLTAVVVWFTSMSFCAAQDREEFVGPEGARVVTTATLAGAMQQAKGYDVTRSTNATRFINETLLRLARRAQRTDPERRPLFISHEAWFRAFLQVARLPEADAPLFSRLAYGHKQDVWIDYRAERVVRSIASGSAPEMSLNVKVWWPAAPGAARSFSFDDSLSVPQLQVTNMRVITYRLLDFGDMIVCDDIHGMLGRPTSGVLGTLFRIIGKGAVVSSRMAIAGDNLQIVHVDTRKYRMGLHVTATVYPDGRTEEGVPAGQPDLAAAEARLKRALDITYEPFASE